MRRIIFWTSFFIIIGLIIWGLVVAMNKEIDPGSQFGDLRPVDATDNIKGPESAAVTLVEFSDFQCPACAIYYPVVKQVLDESSTTVRLVFRHFPLPQHENAVLAAEVAESAGMQGKFWEMHDLLFENQDVWAESPNPKSLFEKYASDLKLDIEKFKTDLESESVKSKVRTQTNEAVAMGVNSTPSFFLNGKPIKNPTSYNEFKSIIEEAVIQNSK